MINKTIIIGNLYYIKIKLDDIVTTADGEFYFETTNASSKLWINGSLMFSNQKMIINVIGSTKQLKVNNSVIVVQTSDVIEIYGTCGNCNVDGDYERVERSVLLHTIENPIEIQLSYIPEPENHMYKNPTDIVNVYGAMRDEVDVINPVILIETDSTISLTNKNYVGFSILGKWRYYFIRNITCVRTNVYRLTLHQDMLTTFVSLIEKAPVFVTRSEGDGGIDGLVDDRLPLKDKPLTKITTMSSDQGGMLTTSLISYSSTPFGKPKTIALSVVNDFNPHYLTDHYDYYLRPTMATSLPQYISPRMGTNPLTTKYVINMSEFTQVTEKLKTQSSLEGYVVSACFFPFDLENLWDCQAQLVGGVQTLVEKDLRINTTDIYQWNVSPDTPIQANLLKGEESSYKVIADFTYNATLDTTLQTSDGRKFLNHDNFSQYDMFIPYDGWIKLNSIDIVDKRIIVYYVCDWITGLATSNVYNVTDTRLIYTNTIQLGTPLGFSRTNIEEITKQRQANITNLMLGLISSSATAIGGFASGNMLTGVMGTIGAVGSIMGAINKNAMLIERANVSTGGDKFGLYSGNYVIVKRTYREPIFAESSTADDIYLRANGLPLNSGDDIENFSSGYIECASVELPFEETISGTKYTLLKDEYDEIVSLLKNGIVI